MQRRGRKNVDLDAHVRESFLEGAVLEENHLRVVTIMARNVEEIELGSP